MFVGFFRGYHIEDKHQYCNTIQVGILLVQQNPWQPSTTYCQSFLALVEDFSPENISKIKSNPQCNNTNGDKTEMWIVLYIAYVVSITNLVNSVTVLSPGIDSQPGGPVRQPDLTYRTAGLHRLAESIPWNWFLGPETFKNSGSGF